MKKQYNSAAICFLHVVSISSLRRWDNDGFNKPSFRTPGGHRRYRYSEILEISLIIMLLFVVLI